MRTRPQPSLGPLLVAIECATNHGEKKRIWAGLRGLRSWGAPWPAGLPRVGLRLLSRVDLLHGRQKEGADVAADDAAQVPSTRKHRVQPHTCDQAAADPEPLDLDALEPVPHHWRTGSMHREDAVPMLHCVVGDGRPRQLQHGGVGFARRMGTARGLVQKGSE